MSQLHILNGEGTALNFRRSGIPGKLMVWNEALACGPVGGRFGTEPFWKQRYSYLSPQVPGLPIREVAPNYETLVVEEFKKLRQIREFDQVTLWFEYDLFCQINLLGLLWWIHSQNSADVPIYLVCIHDFPGKPDFRGLGQLSSGDFQSLLPKKVRLSGEDLWFAAKAWTIYSGSEPGELLELKVPQTYPYLSKAFMRHLSRFPSTFNGLNALQQHLLESIKKHHPTRNQLIGKLIKDLHEWGFGDFQWLQTLQSLDVALNQEERLTLNRTGDCLLAGVCDYLALEVEPYFIGGVLHTAFRWDGQQLIPQDPSYGH